MKKVKPSLTLKVIVHQALLHGAAITAASAFQASMQRLGPEWQFKKSELAALKKMAAKGSPREQSKAKKGDDLA